MFKTDTGLFNKDYRNKAFKMYHPKTGFTIQLNTKKIIDSFRAYGPNFIVDKLRYLIMIETDFVCRLISHKPLSLLYSFFRKAQHQVILSF